MKSVFIICFIISSTLLIGQQPDYQWYLKDGNPLEGLYYNPANNIGSDGILLNAVKHPWITPAKNSIFIIYDDGKYYHTRFEATDPLYVTPVSNYNNLNYGYTLIKGPVTSDIKYMYLTNEYEGDDPYPDVSKYTPATYTGPGATIGYSFPPNGILTAHQDITADSDLVLIIHQDFIKAEELCSGNNVTICYGETIPPNGGPSFISNILKMTSVFYENGRLYNVFNGSGAFSKYPSTNGAGENCFTIDIGSNSSPFVFIALNANFKATDYPPNDGQAYKAKFNLYCSDGNLIESHNEDILSSHDPNYIELQSICKNSNGEQIANYKLNFQNNGSAPANNLFADIELPSCLDPSTICVERWWAGGHKYSDTPALNLKVRQLGGQKIKFEFSSKCQLCSKKTNGCLDKNSTGTIEFCVKEDKSENCDFKTCQLQIGNPYTTFDAVNYGIHDFIDLPKSCELYTKAGLDHIICERNLSPNCQCVCDDDDDDDDTGCWFLNLFKKKKKKNISKKK